MQSSNFSTGGKEEFHWRILLVADDEADYVLIGQMLSVAWEGKVTLKWVSTVQAARDAIFNAEEYDAILVNYDIGQHTGVELIGEVVSRNYPAPILLLSVRGDPEAGDEALRAGAADYLHINELNASFLERSIRYAIERRQMEKELDRRRQERLDILESIQDGFFAIDRDWRIIYINQRVAQIMDVTVEEVLGKNIFETYPKLRNTLAETNYRKVMNERIPIHFEMRGVYKGQWFLISVYPALEGISIYWQDITERKQAEEALRLSEARFNQAFNAYPIALVISRLEDGLIHAVNPSFEQLFGYSPAEVIGKTTFELNMFAQPSDREEAVRRLHADQSLRDFEVDIRTKSGAIRQAYLTVVPITIDEESFILTNIQDITDRKRAEKELREAHNHAAWLARFPDENPNPVARVATDGHVLYCNLAARELSGWPCDGDQQILDPIFPLIQQVIATGSQVEQDVQLGDRIYSFSVTPFLTEQYVNVYGRDVTERKQTEESLKQVMTEVENEKNRLLAVMEALPIGVAILDAQGGHLQANQMFERVWGGTPPPIQSVDDYVAYKAWWVDTGKPVQPEEWASTQAVQKGETIIGQLFEIQRFDGTRTIVFNSGAPIRNAAGQVTGCAVAIMDISEQRRLETEQQEHVTHMEIQRRLMEYREKERQMIARDLHDGPVQDLSSVLFNVQFAKEAITDPAIQIEIEHIGVSLKRAIQNLRELMNELRPPSLVRFGLAKALQIYLEDFREKHPEIALETRLMNDGECLSEQARLNLYRIVQEGLNNAVKHSKATKISLQFSCTGHQADLEIHDNGKGFVVSNDFIDYTLNDHYGLVGMRERAEAVGGTLEIRSKLGKGATVQVSVPLGKGNQ